MINYTTPTISLSIEEIDLTGQDVYVTLVQSAKKLTKTGSDLFINYNEESNETDISFNLTQTESAMFNYDQMVYIQLNSIDSNRVRIATDVKCIPVMRNLLDEVKEYGS